jgi:hypothetical protein
VHNPQEISGIPGCWLQTREVLARHLGHTTVCGPEQEQDWHGSKDARRHEWHRAYYKKTGTSSDCTFLSAHTSAFENVRDLALFL